MDTGFRKGSFAWNGAVAVAVTLIFGGSTVINPVAAASPQAVLQNPQALNKTDPSARRRTRHHAYRPPYRPYYYDRPYYYAPALFVPFNFGYPLLPPPWW